MDTNNNQQPSLEELIRQLVRDELRKLLAAELDERVRQLAREEIARR